MIQCRDCRYWSQSEHEGLGRCEMLGIQELRPSRAVINYKDDPSIKVHSVFTAVMVWAEFGCRLGEQVLRCPQCGSDRTGKGSLILWPDAYCDERCYELYKEAQNSGEEGHHE